MSNALELLMPLIVGMLLGGLFFGGLWWTIRRGLASPRPVVWFLGSLLLRTGLTLAGFYLIAGGNPSRLLACLLGFLVARLIVTRWTRHSDDRESRLTSETRHAS